MKKLVIISGITGAIGSAILAVLGSKKNTIIYGISRQAINYGNFVNLKTGRFYLATFICSLPRMDEKSYRNFINSVDFREFSEVVYIHTLGVYPFEINEKGEHVIENDSDGDGIDDRCTLLSYDIFKWVTSEIIKRTSIPVECVTFGGLADRHQPEIIGSWWRTMEKVETYMRKVADNRISMYKFNISSVVCPHELITRPFVFANTEAEHQSWLSPNQLAKMIFRELRKGGGYYESDVYNYWKGFSPDYYSNEKMTKRRLAEIHRRED
ncbi:MAG: hypothetical protein V1804_01975 [Patescibacteria group bacterium]